MLGEKLFALRKKNSLTQMQLAEAMGISRQSYNNYENNRREPDYNLVSSLADYFNVSTDYLLGRTDEKTDSFQLNTLPHELDLISSLRKLNDKGRAKAVEYITDLTSMDKYIK